MTAAELARARRAQRAGVVRGAVRAVPPPPTAKEIAEEGLFRGFLIGVATGGGIIAALWILSIYAGLP